MIIATVIIVIIVIVIIVIVLLVIVIIVIVILVMLVIVLKIMCMLILVCVKKCLISFLLGFLEEKVLITAQGNGRIYLSARWNQVLILITPFLVVTTALLQSIIPIAIGPVMVFVQ